MRKAFRCSFLAVCLVSWQVPALGFMGLSATDAERALRERQGRKNVTALVETAWIQHFYRGDDERAIAAAREALRLDPDTYEAHEVLANIYQLRGEYDAQFKEMLAMFAQDRMENTTYLPDAVYLPSADNQAVWFSPEQMRALEVLLTQKAAAPTVPPLQKQYHRRLLGQIYRETGRFREWQDLQAQQGFLRDWRYIGSFGNQEKLGFDEGYPPEQRIDLTRTYPGMHWQVGWRNLDRARCDGVVDFNELLQPQEWTTAYALTYVFSPTARPAALRCGSDDSLKLWVNDSLVLSDKTYKGHCPEQHVVGTWLDPGWNKVLVKVCQGSGSWEFSLRVTDPDGTPLPDLQCSTEVRPYTPRSGAGARTGVAVASTESFWQERLTLKPQDERALYYLARTYKNEDRREEAVRTYDRLLRLNPRPARYWLEAGQMNLLDGRPTQGLRALQQAVKLAPGALLARSRLARYYLDQGQYQKADAELEEILRRNPAQAEAYLWSGMNQLTQGHKEKAYEQGRLAVQHRTTFGWAHTLLGSWAVLQGFQTEAGESFQRALELQPGLLASYLEQANMYVRQGRYPDAVRTYRSRLAVSPSGKNDLRLNIAECFQRSRQYREAAQECREVLAVCPENPDAYRRLGMMAYEQGDRAAARKDLEQALRFKPDDEKLRAYVKKLFPVPNDLLARYGVGEAECRRLAALPVTSERFPRSPLAILLDQNLTRVFADGSSSEIVHMMFKVLTPSGRDYIGTIQVPWDDSLKVLKAYTLKPNGEKVEPTDIQPGRITFANVEPGDVVEYQYTHDEYFGGWLKGYYTNWFKFQMEEVPELRAEWVLALPASQHLQVAARGRGIAYDRGVRGEEQVHHWRATDMEPIFTESNRPPYHDLCAMAYATTLPSWEFVSKWEHNLIQDQWELDQALREKLSTLVQGLTTPEEKMRALYDFVAKDIRYTRRGDARVFNVKPQKAANVFADGYGVCKDKALLLIALFKAVGVPAEYTLLNTRDAGQVPRDLPMPWFNHAIVHVPERDGAPAVFLDPTFNYTRYQDLFGQAQGVEAFVCKDGGYEFVRTPVLAPEEAQQRWEETITFPAGGGVHVAVAEQCTGVRSAILRYQYEAAGKQRELKEEELKRVVAGAGIEELEVGDLEDPDRPLTFVYHYQAPSFGHTTDRGFVFSLLGPMNLAETYAERSERRYAVQLDMRWQATRRQTYRIPVGHRGVELPTDLVLDTPWFDYSCRWLRDDQQVKCDRVLTFKVLQVPQAEYAKFREACVRVDASERQEVVLAMPR